MPDDNDKDLVSLVLELHRRVATIEKFIEHWGMQDSDFMQAWNYIRD